MELLPYPNYQHSNTRRAVDVSVPLFHGLEIPIRQYRNSVIPHMMNAAKSLIPRKWQEIESPKIRDWISRVEETYNMEYLRYSGEKDMEGFTNKWKNWKMFKKTQRYVKATNC